MFVLFYFIGGFEDSDTNIFEYAAEHAGLVTAVVVMIVLFIIIWQIFKFLDLQNRVYQIYKHVITYKEGFLTKNFALLPYQNWSVTAVNQTLVDRIFNLYDIKISSKGAGHEIHFKNLRNGRQVSEKLDELINSYENSKNLDSMAAVKTRRTQVSSINYDTTYTNEFRIDTKRLLIPT